jgi:hypothetical protein
MPTKALAVGIAAAVEGAISPAECELLYELASHVTIGCIVEIGSFRGRSTIALALGSGAGAGVAVYAIDPHEPFLGVLGGQFGPADRGAFLKNLLAAGVTDIVRVVNLSSEVITGGWSTPVALLWIDGDHRYDAVKRDFEQWEPFLMPHALIVFHDSLDPDLGPYRVIAHALSSTRYEQIDQLDLTTVLRRC